MRLIDADEVKQLFNPDACISTDTNADKVYVRGLIDAIPTIDAEPIRHGHWVNDFNSPLKCSSCGMVNKANEITLRTDFKFCPYCGAKMDGGTE